MQNFGMSMLWFWIAYVCVTVIGILHTVFNIYAAYEADGQQGNGRRL